MWHGWPRHPTICKNRFMGCCGKSIIQVRLKANEVETGGLEQICVTQIQTKQKWIMNRAFHQYEASVVIDS